MNCIRLCQLAMLALVAVAPAIPSAEACCMGGGAVRAPAPSGGGVGGSIPRVNVPNAGKVDIPRPGDGSGKDKKVITQKEYDDKYKNKFNELRGKLPDDELQKKILDALDNKYVVGNNSDLKLPPEVKTPDQIKQFLKDQFEAKQKQAAADAAAKKAQEDAAWQRKAEADRRAELERQAKAKAAADAYKEEMKKNPALEDDKGWNRTTDPNPKKEAYDNRNMKGQTGAEDMMKK